MILKETLLIGLLLGTISVFSQELSFDKKTKDEILRYEEIYGGFLKDSIKNLGIRDNPQFDDSNYTLIKTKAWIFKRLNDEFNPQLHVWYYFDLETNILKAIRYNWGIFNPSFNPRQEKAKLVELTKSENKFSIKYNKLKKEIIEKFGKPSKFVTTADNADSFVENIFWEDDEKIIELAIRFDRKLKEIPVVGIVTDFHVSSMVTFK